MAFFRYMLPMLVFILTMKELFMMLNYFSIKIHP